MKNITLALAGNPNCGKTTLYNRLTGANRHVGNFPGVTVDCKSGTVRSAGECSVVDLPGLYSLRPCTEEERVARDFLLDEHPDGIINIVDASHMERSLYLTLQLLELRVPTVVALNMMDEVQSNGGAIDVKRLSLALGVQVIPISAAKNEGIDALIYEAVSTVQRQSLPAASDFYRENTTVSQCISIATQTLKAKAGRLDLPARFCAIRLLEGDSRLTTRLSLTPEEQKKLANCAAEMEKGSGMDGYAALATQRYFFLESVCRVCIEKGRESREHRRSVRLDRVLTHRLWALPLFFCITGLFFFLTFGAVGPYLQEKAAYGVDKLTALVSQGLARCGVHPLLHSLLMDGVFAGVGSVIGFLPLIVVLFFFLSILEDSGYMARVAFITDSLFRRIGLSGRSFVPMLVGFGCTVPAAMAARTLPSERDRRMTLLLTPYISCSAKIPIYTVIAAAFFQRQQAPVILCLYLFGLLLGILIVRLLNRAVFPKDAVPFLMELPDYRMPSPKSVFRLMWDKAKDFLKRAFTVILLSSILIWFLQNFDASFHLANDNSKSLLALVGSYLVPLFRPLGFSDWRIVASLLVGITAKEAVISTMTVLYGTKNLAPFLFGKGIFTPPSAVAFLVFTLLYTPCAASIAVFSHELHSRARAFGVAAAQCGVAWLASWLVFHVGSLFF